MPQTEFKFKVPRLYKAATKVVKTVKEEGSDVGELVNEYKKKTNVKALSALVQRVLESEKLVNQIIENTGILKENRADPWLYLVLVTELLLGKKRLPVGCNSIQTVLAYGPKLTIELKKLRKDKRAGKSAEDSSSDESDEAEVVAGEQEEPPQKKKNAASKEEPETSEEEESKELTTPKRPRHSEESKTEPKRSEDYINVELSAVQAKSTRKLAQPHTKKFVSPKQQNLRRFKQFAQRSRSQTPKGKKFNKDKPRYFEVPSSV